MATPVMEGLAVGAGERRRDSRSAKQWDPAAGSLDLVTLHTAFRDGTATVSAVAETVRERVVARADDMAFVSLTPSDELERGARALDQRIDEWKADPSCLPLFGLPFAVKDNIDVAGLPTTAACPAFSDVADSTAPVVQSLCDAGALLVGKTNLDQFATGLVGVRSPYGACRNPFDPEYVAGGSSSGSALAVTTGCVTFSLGTDTAGSGRVPAALNNLVGLKPTRGRVSTRGVVPACRSLDCVSVFALSVEEAVAVLRCIDGHDPLDPWSRPLAGRIPARSTPVPERMRVGVPSPGQLRDCDPDLLAAFLTTVEDLGRLFGSVTEVSIEPFLQAARLLYEGPWVAERLSVVEPLLGRHPDALLPTTAAVITGATRYSAVDAFRASYRLAELRQASEAVWDSIDILVLPTIPTRPKMADLDADPIGPNTKLGTYTNFTNLLDLAALAVPTGFVGDLPTGVTLFAPAFGDELLARAGALLHREVNQTAGAAGHELPSAFDPHALPVSSQPAAGAIRLAVAGAHLAGEPLNHQLTDRGGRLLRRMRTAPIYRCYLLDGEIQRPALVRGDRGVPFEVEVWSLPSSEVGGFLEGIAPPLALGTLVLEDGTDVTGFVCESGVVPDGPSAPADAVVDISEYGSWRNFRASGTFSRSGR